MISDRGGGGIGQFLVFVWQELRGVGQFINSGRGEGGTPFFFGWHNISTGPNDNFLHQFICSKVTAFPTDLEEWLIVGLVKKPTFATYLIKNLKKFQAFFSQVNIDGTEKGGIIICIIITLLYWPLMDSVYLLCGIWSIKSLL